MLSRVELQLRQIDTQRDLHLEVIHLADMKMRDRRISTSQVEVSHPLVDEVPLQLEDIHRTNNSSNSRISLPGILN